MKWKWEDFDQVRQEVERLDLQFTYWKETNEWSQQQFTFNQIEINNL